MIETLRLGPNEEGTCYGEEEISRIVLGLIMLAILGEEEIEHFDAVQMAASFARVAAWLDYPVRTPGDDDLAVYCMALGRLAICVARTHRLAFFVDDGAEVPDEAEYRFLLLQLVASIEGLSRAHVAAFAEPEVPDEEDAVLAFFEELRATGFDFRHLRPALLYVANRALDYADTRALVEAGVELDESRVDVMDEADPLCPEVEADLDRLPTAK